MHPPRPEHQRSAPTPRCSPLASGRPHPWHRYPPRSQRLNPCRPLSRHLPLLIHSRQPRSGSIAARHWLLPMTQKVALSAQPVPDTALSTRCYAPETAHSARQHTEIANPLSIHQSTANALPLSWVWGSSETLNLSLYRKPGTQAERRESGTVKRVVSVGIIDAAVSVLQHRFHQHL